MKIHRRTNYFKTISFRSRIILTFTTITILLVGIISFIGFSTVKRIYLNQLEDQVELTVRMIGASLPQNYLNFLEPDTHSSIASNYYKNELGKLTQKTGLDQIFIFNKDLKTLLSTENIVSDAALLLHRYELSNLKQNQVSTTLPFKGNDGTWYLWGFYRLDDNYLLGVRENARRLAEVDRLSYLYWGIGLLGALLTISAGWFLARTLANPIEKLVSFSKELGKGNFTAKLPQNNHGELSTLTKALDRMRNDLNNQHQEKEKMLAQIAHEIRNPLGGIELLTGLIKEDYQKTGQNSDYANKILKELSGLKQLVSAFLNFSRPAPAKEELVSVKNILESIMPHIQKKLHQKDIQFSFLSNNEHILFDPDQLRQILINLLQNSMEAVDKGGKISVQTEKINNLTILKIVDDGPGIHPDFRSSVFDPFFSTRANGTGLGLAICKKLCIENKADIRVENNSGSGCTFFIIKDN